MPNKNKKVLLCENKRHTPRRVASARFADQSPDEGEVPHPVLDRGEVPIKSWTGRYPIQSWMGGTPFSLGWGGTPSSPGPGGTPSNLGWGGAVLVGGCPQPGPGMGYLLSVGWGTPHLDLGWGTPLVGWMGYPLSPLMVNRQTFPSINITSLVLRARAVKIAKMSKHSRV